MPFDFWTFATQFGLPFALAVSGLMALVRGIVVPARELTLRDTLLAKKDVECAASMAQVRADHAAILDRERAEHGREITEWQARHAEQAASYQARFDRADAQMARLQALVFELTGATRAVVAASEKESIRGP